MEPFGLTLRKVAKKLKDALSTFNRVLNGKSSISPVLALRLSKIFGRSLASWLMMQDNYSLWVTKNKMDLKGIKKIDLIPT